MHSGHKVYVLYDSPHLVKNVRNNLKKHSFNMDGNLVQWKNIEDFYLWLCMSGNTSTYNISVQVTADFAIHTATGVIFQPTFCLV